MSYRLEVKVVIYAETREAAVKFGEMIDEYVTDNFMANTGVLTHMHVEPALKEDGRAVSEDS